MQPTAVPAPLTTPVSAPCTAPGTAHEALGLAELLARSGLERELGRRWDDDPAAVLAEFGLPATAHTAGRTLSDLRSAAVISSGDTPGEDAFAAYTFCINSAQDRAW